MKKLFSFLLFLAVVACLLLLPTEAHAASVNDLTYTIDGGEVKITDCNTSATGELVIPETIEGYPVTSIGYQAFYGCSSLTSVTMGKKWTKFAGMRFTAATNYSTCFASGPKQIGIGSSSTAAMKI